MDIDNELNGGSVHHRRGNPAPLRRVVPVAPLPAEHPVLAVPNQQPPPPPQQQQLHFQNFAIPQRDDYPTFQEWHMNILHFALDLDGRDDDLTSSSLHIVEDDDDDDIPMQEHDNGRGNHSSKEDMDSANYNHAFSRLTNRAIPGDALALALSLARGGRSHAVQFVAPE